MTLSELVSEHFKRIKYKRNTLQLIINKSSHTYFNTTTYYAGKPVFALKVFEFVLTGNLNFS